MRSILVVDDERSVRESIKLILEYEKYTVHFAENGDRAIASIEEESPETILLDIKMPGKDGLEVLRDIRVLRPEIPVIMISGHGTIDTAVEATKLGAFDFLPKPLDREKLLITVRNAIEHRRLSEEVRRARIKEEILGASQKIKDILSIVARVGPTEARVMITGESGTGKELVAKAIHRASKRSSLPMVEVNCAAIPSELIESELFGHEKGAFTGATAQRIGKFEQADEGTIFLDEVGDMSLQAQAKVLRVLEEGRIERVGGNKVIPVNVRVLSATNKNLGEEIAEGRFREDLYHRLNVIPIALPPLRERREDIPILVQAFIRDACSRNGIALKRIDDATVKELTELEWSGNVRELRNIVERLVIMSPSDTIKSLTPASLYSSRNAGMDDILGASATFQEFKDKSEAAFIKRQLELHNWHVSKTAEALQMERSHLYTKIKKYGLEREEKESES